MQFGPRIPDGGKAMAIFGLILIAIFWIAPRSAATPSSPWPETVAGS